MQIGTDWHGNWRVTKSCILGRLCQRVRIKGGIPERQATVLPWQTPIQYSVDSLTRRFPPLLITPSTNISPGCDDSIGQTLRKLESKTGVGKSAWCHIRSLLAACWSSSWDERIRLSSISTSHVNEIQFTINKPYIKCHKPEALKKR